MGRKKRQPDEQLVMESTTGGELTATPSLISSISTNASGGTRSDGLNSTTAVSAPAGGPAVKRRKNAKQDKNNDVSRQSSLIQQQQQEGSMLNPLKFEYKQDTSSIKAEPPGTWGHPDGFSGPLPPGSMGPPYPQYLPPPPPPHMSVGQAHCLPSSQLSQQQSNLAPNYAHGNNNEMSSRYGPPLPPMILMDADVPSNLMRHCGPPPPPGPSLLAPALSEMSRRGHATPTTTGSGEARPPHHMPSNHHLVDSGGPSSACSQFLPPPPNLMLPSSNNNNRCAPPPALFDKHAAAAAAAAGGGPPMMMLPPNTAPPNAGRVPVCRGCRQIIFNEDAIVCEAKCLEWFHRQCSGLTPFAFHCLNEEPDAVWVCDVCINTQPNSIPMVMLGSGF